MFSYISFSLIPPLQFKQFLVPIYIYIVLILSLGYIQYFLISPIIHLSKFLIFWNLSIFLSSFYILLYSTFCLLSNTIVLSTLLVPLSYFVLSTLLFLFYLVVLSILLVLSTLNVLRFFSYLPWLSYFPSLSY